MTPDWWTVNPVWVVWSCCYLLTVSDGNHGIFRFAIVGYSCGTEEWVHFTDVQQSSWCHLIIRHYALVGDYSLYCNDLWEQHSKIPFSNKRCLQRGSLRQVGNCKLLLDLDVMVLSQSCSVCHGSVCMSVRDWVWKQHPLVWQQQRQLCPRNIRVCPSNNIRVYQKKETNIVSVQLSKMSITSTLDCYNSC